MENTLTRNLTARLGRKPTKAERAGLEKTRKQGKNENAYIAGLKSKKQSRLNLVAELKAVRAAAAMEVKAKAKGERNFQKAVAAAAKKEAKALKAAEKKEESTLEKEEKAFQKALRAETRKIKKSNTNAAKTSAAKTSAAPLNTVAKTAKRRNMTAKKEANLAAKAAKKEARETRKVAKLEAAEKRKVAFALAESQARNNLSRTLGKAPQMMNIKRLAAIRTSGANLSTNDYIRVKNYAKTLKAKNTMGKLFKENVRNVAPEIDVCTQGEMKKFLENAND